MNHNHIVKEDLANIYSKLSKEELNKLKSSTILITGCGGFLGFYFMQFFSYFSSQLQIKKIIGLENFLTGDGKQWMQELEANYPDLISLHEFDVVRHELDTIPGIDEADIIIHLASIASPTFYRIYPLETLDANIIGLRKLLDKYAEKRVKGFLFFSSSEIYGDPFPEFIPTKEDYRGNVATIGPRACYDEAKRFGETLCYVFAQKYQMPIGVVRPFNNFGPGMSLNDRRLPADFAQAVVNGKDIEIFSDGTPTRTFCYITDAIQGYLKTLLHGHFDIFNIGMDKPEISVADFARLFKKQGEQVFDYTGKVDFKLSQDKDYMTDNPNRRCPDISKAKAILDYQPSISVEEGIGRYLSFLKADIKS